MKMFFRFIVLSAIILPGAAFSAGYYLSGTVSVTPTLMDAKMNVRFNGAVAGSPYVYATGYAGSTIAFAGRDSQNEYFYCYVPTTSPIHAAAEDIKNNLKSGSRLYVTKTETSSECTNVFLGNYSYFVD